MPTRFEQFLQQAEAAKVYLLEVDAWNESTGVVETLYFSTSGFTTSPTDTPANTYYPPRIKTPLMANRSMFTSGKTTTRSVPQYGDMELENIDGQLDGLAGYGFDGRYCRVYLGGEDFTKADFGRIFTGKILSANVGRKAVVLKLRDVQEEINTPIQPNLYSGMGGFEGVAGLAGAYKPLVFGRVLNITPTLIDPFNLLYHVHDGRIAAINAVYDNGATIPPANYVVDLPNGTFRLLNTPVGEVTADVDGHHTGTEWLFSAASIMKHIAIRCGVKPSEIDDAAFAALDAIAPQTVGIYVPSGQATNGLDVMDAIARSVGAFYGTSRDGMFTCGRLAKPGAETPVATFDESNILRDQLDTFEPAAFVKKVIVNFARNWTVQTTLAGIVQTDPDAYTFKTSQSLTATAQDSTVLTAHPYAEDLTFETLLVNPVDALAEANRLLALYKTPPAMFKLVSKAQPYALSINDVVLLKHSRFGLAAGKKMRVLTMNERSSRNEIELTLWG